MRHDHNTTHVEGRTVHASYPTPNPTTDPTSNPTTDPTSCPTSNPTPN